MKQLYVCSIFFLAEFEKKPPCLCMTAFAMLSAPWSGEPWRFQAKLPLQRSGWPNAGLGESGDRSPCWTWPPCNPRQLGTDNTHQTDGDTNWTQKRVFRCVSFFFNVFFDWFCWQGMLLALLFFVGYFLGAGTATWFVEMFGLMWWGDGNLLRCHIVSICQQVLFKKLPSKMKMKPTPINLKLTYRYIEPEKSRKSCSARTVSFLGLRFHSSLSSQKSGSTVPPGGLYWNITTRCGMLKAALRSGEQLRGSVPSSAKVDVEREVPVTISWFRWGLDLAPSPVLLWNKFGGRNILSSHKVTTKLMRIWEVEIITIATWQ